MQPHVAYSVQDWKPYRKNNNAYNMQYIVPSANDGPIVRAARSIDYPDPSIALRKQRVGREIPRFAKVNVHFFAESY